MNLFYAHNRMSDPLNALPPGSARIVLRAARRGACFSWGAGASLRAVRAVSSASRNRVIAL